MSRCYVSLFSFACSNDGFSHPALLWVNLLANANDSLVTRVLLLWAAGSPTTQVKAVVNGSYNKAKLFSSISKRK